MLERTKRKTCFEDIISEDYKFYSKSELSAQELRYRRCKKYPRSLNDPSSKPDDCNMTRKTRARRPRIQVLQSGYCAICSVPYNSVEDHIQSKKHQKLIGEDANYIALNGYIHSDVGIESLLSLTGIDAIGFDNDFSPKVRKRSMPRTRTTSVVSDTKTVLSTSTRNNSTGHHLRSRKNINYMTPPLEEDSFPEKPDLEPVRLEYKEYRELRSSTRALAKLTSVQPKDEPEVWSSGRAKRSCSHRQKRISADERLVADNKTYYKVEVLSNKLRSTDSKERENKPLQSSKPNESEKLIVKFKKLRNSELVQLNNEATNFLFPKKEESSDEDENEASASSDDQCGDTLLTSSDGGDFRRLSKVKIEDEGSIDSITSEFNKKRKKRRTHAEVFINDNQKYYKFETPGSRLRYHGSYLSPIPMKSNGDCVPKVKREINRDKFSVSLDEYKFSFESIPQNEAWYQTFTRQDQIQQRYSFTPNYHWNDFVMPYQMPSIKPMDPNVCISAYRNLVTCLKQNAEQGSKEPELECVPMPVPEIETDDENSKISTLTVSSGSASEEVSNLEAKKPNRRGTVSPTGSRNPRKSPRQHASTLAILSSLIQQRKRRSRSSAMSEPPASLQTIPEEEEQQEPQEKPAPSPQKSKKKTVDYFDMALKIEEELDSALDCDFDVETDVLDDTLADFKNSEVRVNDILTLYEESKQRERAKACRKLLSSTPGRRPGKRKKNKTGWPNKVKRRRHVKEEDSTSVNVESDEDAESTDSIKVNLKNSRLTEGQTDCKDFRIGNDSGRNSVSLPFVYVKKLDGDKILQSKTKKSPVRTSKRQKRTLGSPKSPRMLRRPRGRWYRER